METIVKINFTEGPIATGFIHLNENHEIVKPGELKVGMKL